MKLNNFPRGTYGVEFFHGARGGLNLRLGRHSFFRHMKTKGKGYRWSCSFFRRKCKAHLIITDTLNVLKTYTEHNHPPADAKESEQKEIKQKKDDQAKTTTSDTQTLEQLVKMLTGVTKHSKDATQNKKDAEEKCTTSAKQEVKQDNDGKKQKNQDIDQADKTLKKRKTSEDNVTKPAENLKNVLPAKASKIKTTTSDPKEDSSDEDVIEVDVRSQPHSRNKTTTKKQAESLEKSGDSVVHKARGNAHRWSCTFYGRKCRAHLIITDTLNVLKAYTQHNHPPVATEKKKEEKKKEQKAKDEKPNITPSESQGLEHLVELLTDVTKHGRTAKQNKDDANESNDK
ncbi:FLYWCH zinc finger domain-containing protein [Phthorimaea operculella]|nr:FLYWCH zinc finger domain-containing protein [Phthorimaea operculella]